MTKDESRFREKPTIFGAVAKTVAYSLILSIVLAIPVYATFRMDYMLLFVILLLLFALHYLDLGIRRPSRPMQVYETLVILPEKKAWKLRGGQLSKEKENKPYFAKIVPFRLDLQSLIHDKGNRNVLICGASGSGKSKLSRYLLNGSRYQKVIFSFKPNDEYLKMGYSTADISTMLPNPFSNTEAFISAFLVAFPLTATGIQASLIPTTLERLAKRSNNWKDFSKLVERAYASTKDNNTRSALAFVQANLSRLVYKTSEFGIGRNNVVLDFNKLNESAKSFYAELILRQLYADLEAVKRKDLLICVDEAHRLTANKFANYHTILVEMSREIRDKGMLWTVTQNYADIPDQIRSQFGTQFVFKVTSQNDLNALRAIDPLLSWTISSLPKYHFVDTQFQDIHTLIPAYYYNAKGEKDIKIMPKMESMEESIITLTKDVTDRPTATQHAAMVALYKNRNESLSKLAKYLKEKGWITGEPTIYGARGRPGVFDSLVSRNFAKKEVGKYRLTAKGLEWVEPERIMKRISEAGSDLHRQLLEKTIEKLHDKNFLVIVPDGKKASDLIGFPMGKGKKKYLWDDANKRAYEIQTTARKENIFANKNRNKASGLRTTWVTYSTKVMDEIKKLTENSDEYLLIKV